jgi:hypothetical protein
LFPACGHYFPVRFASAYYFFSRLGLPGKLFLDLADSVCFLLLFVSCHG